MYFDNIDIVGAHQKPKPACIFMMNHVFNTLNVYLFQQSWENKSSAKKQNIIKKKIKTHTYRERKRVTEESQ